VIVPCYNEEKFIGQLIENILAQDYPSNQIEVIFVDGASTDKTKELILQYSSRFPIIRNVDNPERYVPHALNLAIRASNGEIIVRLDAHAKYPLDYFSVLVKKLIEYKADNVGGMWVTKPGADTIEAKAIVLATSHPVGIGNAGYRLGAKEDMDVDTVPFGCFRRDIFDRIGCFDPDLLRNQDDEFNGRILKNGGRIVMVPSVKIEYFARPDLGKLKTMFYQYGLFKPLVNLKLGAPATLRQFAPPLFILSLICLAILGVFSTLFAVMFLAEIIFYGMVIVLTSLSLTNGKGLMLFVKTCITFPVIHFSYGIGYIQGLFRFTFLKAHLRKNQIIKSNR